MAEPGSGPGAHPRRRVPVVALAATTGAIAAALLYLGTGAGNGPAAGPAARLSAPLATVRTIAVPDRPPAPGFDAPLIGTGGRTLGLGQLAGRVVVLDFWASWCVSCRQELSAVERARHLLAADVVVVGVDVRDGPAGAGGLARRAGATYPLLSDPGGRIAAAYQVVGVPTLVVIDRQGRIAARALGPADPMTIVALTGPRAISNRSVGGGRAGRLS